MRLFLQTEKIITRVKTTKKMAVFLHEERKIYFSIKNDEENGSIFI